MKYKKGYTTGVYDMLHIGHVNIFKNAKQFCNYLVVGVTTDELCFKRKNKYPIIKQDERKKIVESIRYVDEVVLQEDMDKLKAVKKLNCDVVFVGSDWQGTESWNKYEREFNEIGVDVVYLPHTDGISSTIIRKKIEENK